MTTYTRLLLQMRRTAVLDAIRYELTERSNRRVAQGLPAIGKLGSRPRPPLPWLCSQMERAREIERVMVEG